MRKILYILFLVVSTAYPQTDWQKWEAKQVSYELPTSTLEVSKTESNSLSGFILKPLKSLYSILISDYDGDTCPFTPSCADFFVQASEETNFFSGLLIFADRFTRDMNVFKGATHYSLHKSGKYFDPAYNYTLNLQKIKFGMVDN